MRTRGAGGSDERREDEGVEALAARALEGSRAALGRLVRRIQDDVRALAVRMLWDPADAEDATQEILIRVITGLDTFRGDCAFSTWVYRVASNHLLTTRRRRAERPELTFEAFGEELERGLADDPVPGETEIQRRLLVEEVKIGCSHGMLLCLDRGHRLAYVLGEILGLDHRTGAEVLEISPAAFRKRLSRARRRLHGFLRERCGLVDPENPCRCHRRVGYAIRIGRVDPDDLLFAGRGDGESWEFIARRGMEEVEALRDEAVVLRTNPRIASRRDFAAALAEVLDEERYGTIAGEGG